MSGSVRGSAHSLFTTTPSSMGQICVSAARFLWRAPRLDHGKAKVWCPAHLIHAPSRVGGCEDSVSQSGISQNQPLCGESGFLCGNRCCEKDPSSAASTVFTSLESSSDRPRCGVLVVASVNWGLATRRAASWNVEAPPRCTASTAQTRVVDVLCRLPTRAVVSAAPTRLHIPPPPAPRRGSESFLENFILRQSSFRIFRFTTKLRTQR